MAKSFIEAINRALIQVKTDHSSNIESNKKSFSDHESLSTLIEELSSKNF